MSLTSVWFAGFVVLCLTLYYRTPPRHQTALLVVASYVFILTWSWWYAVIVAGVTLVNFFIALNLTRTRRSLLWAGIGFNVLTLAVFKYEQFFLPDFRRALDAWGIETGIGGVEFLLPIGMSFYVVALISYLVDVFRAQTEPQRHLLDFALYVVYFPKLLAGPIERAGTFLPQLREPRVVDNDVLARSFTLIMIGLVRKIVIANSLFYAMPPGMWKNPAPLGASMLLLYLIVYSFALYNDFAGYTNIARGVSGLFGIGLSRNFAMPYFARNISEFWNRWHITLSQWLRDYIYFPTSRALLRRNPRRDNIPNLLLPPMLTMLVSALWHGTGWTMIVWGVMHGVYLIAERLLGLRKDARPAMLQPAWKQFATRVVVFILVAVAWVPFRAPSLHATWQYYRTMTMWLVPIKPPLRVLVLIAIVVWIDWAQSRTNDEVVFLRWTRPAQVVLFALALLAIFLVSQIDSTPPFVYQGF